MPDVGCAGLLVEDTFCGPMVALPPQGALSVLPAMPVRAGGCAANVAIDLAKQGISVDVVGCVGNDSAAGVLFKAFVDHNVGYSGVVRAEDKQTSKTVILLIEGDDRRYLHITGANSAFSVNHIPRPWLSSIKVFYLGGLFALPGIELQSLANLLKHCRAAGVKTVVDVVAPEEHLGMTQIKKILPWIDVFVPNEDEARALTGVSDPLDQLRTFEAAGAHTVIITRGGEGSVASSHGKKWNCGTYLMDVVDPSGSGDAFTSGVIRSLLLGWDIPQTLRYASAIGASATRAAGTTDAVFTHDEAEAFIKDHPLTVTEA